MAPLCPAAKTVVLAVLLSATFGVAMREKSDGPGSGGGRMGCKVGEDDKDKEQIMAVLCESLQNDEKENGYGGNIELMSTEMPSLMPDAECSAEQW
eukprot:CAMPEP_0179321654 /NCGR_PEP_ID=MMETSP0797-20121207/58735_1 /TAXON_ID=47934 /ORGANISM="Dinophysis acuminata, Strain DAEP01" /LENGTH=95 /DNA_ID=CAMNT_0021033309 /DNA_START=48 /DNA_END=332 /DNA_ORIENTATION=-